MLAPGRAAVTRLNKGSQDHPHLSSIRGKPEGSSHYLHCRPSTKGRGCKRCREVPLTTMFSNQKAERRLLGAILLQMVPNFPSGKVVFLIEKKGGMKCVCGYLCVNVCVCTCAYLCVRKCISVCNIYQYMCIFICVGCM